MKRFIKYLYYCALTFCSLFALYYITNPTAEDKVFFFYCKSYFFAALVTPLPFFLNHNLSWKHILCETIIGVTWSIMAPILHRFTYGNANLPIDIAAGCYAFSLLITMKWYFRRYLPRWLANTIIFMLNLLALLPPLLNAIYYSIYKHPIGIKAMMAIMQTNPLEAKEYLLSTPFYIYLIFFLAIIAFASLYRKQLQSEEHYYHYENYTLPKIGVIIVLIPSIAIFSTLKIFPDTKVIDSAYQAYNYFRAIAFYSESRAEILKDLHIKKVSPMIAPQSIVLVIGESASRDYMHAFTNIRDNTTPWLSNNRDKFILFDNAYSCAYSTIVSLQHALTSANFYNQEPFTESISIIDIAKAKGYKTYWFSNQGKIGQFDTPITLIAEQSDHAVWLGSSKRYDGMLVEMLSKVDPQENNFIVFHLMGSHAFYSSRYPEEYQIWKSPNQSGGVEDYKNSILYTDKVLKDIFEHSQAKLNLASFVYLSDHATDPTILRDPDSNDFKNLRIPMFAYLSDEYKAINPSLASELEANKHLPFSNDLLYNLICSIFNIESNSFEEDESIASPKYKYNISNVKTNYGKALIKDDPYR